jgi:predicted esterase/predicted Ser/Thr protein kinase
MIGRTLSHYAIETPLGKGGMGEVYLARDSRLDRDVAIKVLTGAPEEGDRVRRFLTEAKAASALNHPNIVTVHDIDRDGAVHYIVMERIEGQPLTSVTGSPMALERFLQIALQISSALGAAHAAGIVHRDIKPANVMLTTSGTVKVVDFGLARLLKNEPDAAPEESTAERLDSLTKPGTTLGTIGYMSPEQAQGRRVDARSDVFSLGVLFYELLSGKPAFRRDTQMATLAAIISESLPPLRAVRRDVPRQLETIVQRCLEKDPASRFADASEIHGALLEVRNELAPAAPGKAARRWLVAAVTVILLGLIAAAAFVWRRESQLRWARNFAVSEVERLLEAEDPAAAYEIAKRARAIAPDDSQVQVAWANLTGPVTLTTEPPGAEISIRSYKKPGQWLSLGRAPIRADIPWLMLRYRVAREGYVPTETAPEVETTKNFRLHRPSERPEGGAFVEGGEVTFGGTTLSVPDFWIDVHEVTNADYRKFVASGGYGRPELWKHPFRHQGQTLSREAAMRQFVDATGRPGPAGWELGAPPEGKENHPVEGISWYEAAAYAEFAGKSLPTVFHWKRAAANEGLFSDILAMSNFGGKGTVPVAGAGGLGAWGTQDMAGNVREWCLNAVGEARYILGGSWLDAAYSYGEADAQSPLTRRPGFGVRLMQRAPVQPQLIADVTPARYEPPPPVDDAAFSAFARLYDYDPAPLNTRVEEVDDSHDAWRKEKVSFDAAYRGERVTAFVFLPRNARPPYQAIVYFPGSDAVLMKSSRSMWMRAVDFYIRSGRVVIFPVYKGTYERGVPAPRGHNDRRDLLIQRAKDIRRAVDYLQSRPDIDRDRISFYGLSLGASVGTFVLPFEPRFRTAILFGTGIYWIKRPPEMERTNYLPRIKLPVLLIAGRYDFGLPVETSQKPFFNLLGTPPDRKKHVVFEGGHVPTQFNDAVREMLAWTDQWMGTVR